MSGYTVPVMSGALSGSVIADGVGVDLTGTGYHDHNWGFWEGVSWRWGQVQHEGLSYVYGRVIPPPDAADPARLPGFLVALGPDGPVGYTTSVTIEETDDPRTRQPQRIVVTGRGRDLNLRMDIDVESTIVNRGGPFSAGPSASSIDANSGLCFTAPRVAHTLSVPLSLSIVSSASEETTTDLPPIQLLVSTRR